MSRASNGEHRSNNHFAIIAHGVNFDVDRFVNGSPLPISQVWRRGEKRPGGFEELTNGICIELGDAAELSIVEQQEIAAAYLAANETALKQLKSIPAVETFYLGIQEEVMRASAGSLFDLNPRLMQLVLKVGLQLTIWAVLDKRSELQPLN